MNFRDVLKSPLVYRTYQGLVGGLEMRSECLRQIDVEQGDRILDIGCGPAYYLAELPPVDYHGFDTDAAYIAHARRRFAGRGQFYCEPFDKENAEALGSFDKILLMGLLHHLDDEACDGLLSLLASCLKPGGIVIALDTVVHDGQNRVERALAEGDRGEYVRQPEGFEALGRRHFGEVEGMLSNKFWIPSIYFIMKMRAPHTPSNS